MKKTRQLQNQWKNQKANQQNPKNTKAKIEGGKRGKKKESQKGKKWGTNGLVHLHVFCFRDLFSLAFISHLVCFLPGKKQNKMGNKSKT